MVGSRFTHAAEANYSPTDGVLLTVADALLKTKYFALDRPNLMVGTDHMPLLGLLAGKHLDADKLLRRSRYRRSCYPAPVYCRMIIPALRY